MSGSIPMTSKALCETAAPFSICGSSTPMSVGAKPPSANIPSNTSLRTRQSKKLFGSAHSSMGPPMRV